MLVHRFLFVPLLVLSVHSMAESLCFIGEQPAFSCDIKQKSLSVCVAGDDSLFYRYGTRQNLEMNLASDTHFSATGYSGGGEGRLTFHNGKYDYVVYSKIISGEWIDREAGIREKQESAGVYVIKKGKQVADLSCTEPEDARITSLPEYEMETFVYYD
ncbi:hypothetical protein [Gynuella sp.]|uniref:hypothetical protein n=1 Tax=Gynuella sp. TaxID=2969146 RepID=UPI003D09A3CE